jgi:hypothetical protein
MKLEKNRETSAKRRLQDLKMKKKTDLRSSEKHG